MNRIFLLVGLLFLAAQVGGTQDTIRDGLQIWTTSWDDGSPQVGYDIMHWTYSAQEGSWTLEPQYVLPPEIAEEDYFGNVYDMGMDMIILPGRTERSAILTVSMGDGHFPSEGTQFQHRVLNEDGEWELAQPPLFTTPPDISPLGVDIYLEGDELHIAWIEDNDEAGPASMMCEIYDQVYSVNSDGILSAEGDPVLAYSRQLNWGGTYPGQGGITGLTVCDYDRDGDKDFIVGEMFYGERPYATAIHLIEKLSPNEWPDSLEELWVGWPDTASEGVCYSDIDGDDQIDIINTSGADGSSDTIHWFEKQEGTLQVMGMILDCDAAAESWDLNIGHIFGLHSPPPETTGVLDWEIME